MDSSPAVQSNVLSKKTIFNLPTLQSPTGKYNPNVQFPADAGVVNVVTAGADPTGATDCTSVIQGILSASFPNYGSPLIIYFPNGNYLVSGQILCKDGNGNWCCCVTFQGQSRHGVTIRLADNTTAFNNASSPIGILVTASKPYSPGFNSSNGNGNEAFSNFVSDMTIDCGNNVGAFGIDFEASNCGSVRRVTVKGSNFYGGLALQRSPGPLFIKDVTVLGGVVGFGLSGETYSMMFEDVCATGQSQNAFQFYAEPFCVRNLVTDTPIEGTGDVGSATLIESPNGYADVLNGENMLDTFLNGAYSSLRINNIPEVYPDPLSQWANATTYSGGIQAALSAASTVYFPVTTTTSYNMGSTTFTLPTTLNRLTFLNTSPNFGNFSGAAPVFETTGNTTEPLIIEHGWLQIGGNNPYWILHNSTRPLILRDLTLNDGSNTIPGVVQGSGAGPIYIDDFCGSGVQVATGGYIYARQLNYEGTSTPSITNIGGTIWVMGCKTENDQPNIVVTSSGGVSVVLGIFAYPLSTPSTPMIVTTNSTHAIQFSTAVYTPGHDYSTYVETNDSGTIVDYTGSSFSGRGYGHYGIHAHPTTF